MGTKDLRGESGMTDRAQFTRAIDELQRALKVIPAEVLYKPVFTYIWSLAEGRFLKELSAKVNAQQGSDRNRARVLARRGHDAAG